jgi:hypothetical protein
MLMMIMVLMIMVLMMIMVIIIGGINIPDILKTGQPEGVGSGVSKIKEDIDRYDDA